MPSRSSPAGSPDRTRTSGRRPARDHIDGRPSPLRAVRLRRAARHPHARVRSRLRTHSRGLPGARHRDQHRHVHHHRLVHGHRVVLVELESDRAGIDRDGRTSFYRMVLERLSALPSVASVGASYVTPLNGGTWQSNLTVDEASGARAAHAFFHVVTPGYFETYRTKVIAGRRFSAADGQGAQQVVLVNKAFVSTVPGNGSFVGRRSRCDVALVRRRSRRLGRQR